MYWPFGRRFLIGLIPALVMLGFSGKTFAQTDCADPEVTLKIASEEFEKGHFFSVPEMVIACVTKGGFSRQQLERVYVLLVQTYLILEDQANAEAYYLK
ncbi:MAG: hypothetical protein ACK5X6_00660, partial [Chryseotalea sp.]